MTIDTAALRNVLERVNYSQLGDAAVASVARTALPELLDTVEALKKVAEAAEYLRKVRHMHHVPRQINEGKAMLQLDKALRDAGYGG